jgi:CPA1 family monovalent cation:H+ antiporter
VRSVETVLFLVVLATVVASLARRLSVPAPSLLVVAGIVVGVLPGVPAIRITPEVVSLVVLPPLLYAAGEELAWRDVKQVWRPVTVLAVGLVLATAVAVAAVTMLITPLSGSMAFVLGAILASTDPVAVTALGRRLALPGKVQALVQAESLFNDATSLVLFRVAVGVALAGGGIAWGHAGWQFLLLGGGGALVGAAVGAGVVLIRQRVVDAVMETVIALVTPYAGYVLAEALHTSGVTAVVVGSLVIGARTTRITTAHTRLQVHAVYATVVFLLESVIFAVIGLELPTLIRDAPEQLSWLWRGALLTAVLIGIRALWVFPLSAAAQKRRGTDRMNWWTPAVMSWAGARGVVPLAAALSIPLVADNGSPLAGRELVMLLTATVIVFTLVVQGFSLEPLVKRSRIGIPATDVRRERSAAREVLARAALAELDERAATAGLSTEMSAPAVKQVRRMLEARLAESAGEQSADEPASNDVREYRALRRDLIAAEALELDRLYQAGTIGDATRRQLQHALDLEEAGLGQVE